MVNPCSELGISSPWPPLKPIRILNRLGHPDAVPLAITLHLDLTQARTLKDNDSYACLELILIFPIYQAMAMAKKRTKVDRLERQTEQLGKRVDRHPDQIEKKPSTLAPKSDEPTVLIPMEQQIQQRAYELYEQRGRTDGQDLDDWLQAESEIKGTQAKAATA